MLWVASVLLACPSAKTPPPPEETPGSSGPQATPPPSGCTPATCAARGKSCGTLSDGCGGTLECGACPSGESCGAGGVPNVCAALGCVPATCAGLGKNCGTLPDGCGGTISCGTCEGGLRCGGGGVANVCGAGACAPASCEAQGKDCGLVSDGCGGVLSCGACAGSLSCGGGGQPNVCGRPGSAAGPSVCGPEGFCWLSPLPQGDLLSGTWGISSSDFWAVGPAHHALHWDGTQWTAFPTGLSEPLNGIWGASRDDVWAVGSRILHWDGLGWRPVAADVPRLHAVHGVSADRVWAVGEGGAVFHWDGARWTELQSQTPRTLLSVWAVSAGELWVGGESGTLRRWRNGAWTDHPFGQDAYTSLWASSGSDVWAVGARGSIVHWDGTRWTLVRAEQSSARLHAVWGSSSTDVWFFGNGEALRWNGTAFIPEPLDGDAPGELLAAWGARGELWTVGRYGTALARRGGWRRLTGIPAREAGEPAYEVRALSGSAPDDVWLVGYSPRALGKLVHWNGASFSAVESPVKAAWSAVLSLGRTDAWAVGPLHRAIRWDGARWSEVPTGLPEDPLRALTALWASGPNDVWAVGSAGTVIRWNGSSWRRVDVGTDHALTGIWGSGPDDIWISAAASPSEPDRGLMAHFDGRAWTLQRGFPPLQGVWGGGPNDVWASARDQVWRWNGGTWASQSVSGAYGPIRGTGLGDVYVAGFGGRLLRWSRGGWSSVQTATRENLLALWSTGGEIWAAGQGSTVLRKRP